MELFIKIVDGQPVEHPILGENLRQVYGNFDDSNIPNGFAKFNRIEKPELSAYLISDLFYRWVNDEVQDVWITRSMTDQEKQEKIDFVKTQKPFNSWIFDEQICMWKPPIDYPQDGRFYNWNEENKQWMLLV